MNGDLRKLHSPLRQMIEDLPVDGVLTFPQAQAKQVIQTVQRVRDASDRLRRFRRSVVDEGVRIERLPDEGQAPVRVAGPRWDYFASKPDMIGHAILRRYAKGRGAGFIWTAHWPENIWTKSVVSRENCASTARRLDLEEVEARFPGATKSESEVAK